MGKQALQEKVADKTQLRIDDSTLIQDKKAMADMATLFYKSLLDRDRATCLAPEVHRREEKLGDLMHQDFTEEASAGLATSDIVLAAVNSCLRRRTCAASHHIVTEMW